MQKWEYVIVDVVDAKWTGSWGEFGELTGLGGLSELVNRLGDQGFELCAALAPDDLEESRLIFKRPK